MNRDKQLTILLAGVGIGAVAGFLVAGYSDVDLRKGVRKRAGEVKDLLKDKAEALMDRVQTAAEEGQDQLGNQLTKGKDAARDFSNKAKDAVENAAAVTADAAEEILDKSKTLVSKASRALEHHGTGVEST